jgi:putative hydrolase of the HAD superfamily
MIELIAFDADDTLWHSEVLYTRTQDRFKRLLSPYHDDDRIDEELNKIEMRNLARYGYGIKGFTLSMIETAIELTEGSIQGREIGEILAFARDMLQAPVLLLDQAEKVVATLARSHELMLITKGDLFDQETKIARSGLAPYFAHVEIVSAKTPEIYQALLDKQELEPWRFLMVGNSLRSDILPVVALGGLAVYIPYHVTWLHEAVAEQGEGEKGYFELEQIGQLPALVERLSAR